ncbi:hypothetical protein B0H13DRAFT_1901275 [Mycena leptocephala]|nr:hypothetical protein B0H13DRAFT_1901275 [Mycena leptocephala]
MYLRLTDIEKRKTGKLSGSIALISEGLNIEQAQNNYNLRLPQNWGMFDTSGGFAFCTTMHWKLGQFQQGKIIKTILYIPRVECKKFEVKGWLGSAIITPPCYDWHNTEQRGPGMHGRQETRHKKPIVRPYEKELEKPPNPRQNTTF